MATALSAVSPDVEASCGGTARFDAVIFGELMVDNHALQPCTTESVGASLGSAADLTVASSRFSC
ncbi:hypothetical protein X771_29655 [Mesorhizobium sp. LSJC277A00]|nr:hypothetical protein X771_29655 [Mesorhizobium sp. LSJC277A00]